MHTSGGSLIKTKIIVATHTEAEMPTNAEIYLPVLVGAKKNWKPDMHYQRDDEGINISAKNESYSELTGLFWAWKNLKHCDAVGLVHYRRYLANKTHGSLTSVLNQSEVDHLLEESDIILPRKRHYYIESNYSHYIHAHKEEALFVTKDIIKTKFPEYSDSFDQCMHHTSAHMFNMFVMKQQPFDEYCSWLFEVLELLEKKINLNEYLGQERRVFGYISELLLDVWITNHTYSYTEVHWIQLGSKHLVRKIISFMLRKMGFNHISTHF